MMRVRNLVLISVAGVALSGCATPIIGAMTLSQLSTIAGIASSITTGKGLGDHALSIVTGKDCSVTEGILRKDRNFCEERGSLAAKEDFKGVFAWLDKKNGGSGEGVIALYEHARSDELARADQQNQVATDVVPASASGVNLRLLTFLSDDADGKPQMTTRYVYMMAPIPDQVVADATPTTVAATDRSTVATIAAASPAPEARPATATDSARPVPAARYEPAAGAAVAQEPRPMIYWYLSGR